MSERLSACPHCGVALENRVLTVEVQGVYDGGLYFMCPECGGKWHRWPEGTWQYTKAREYVEAATDETAA